MNIGPTGKKKSVKKQYSILSSMCYCISYLDANMFQAFLTILSRGFKRDWLLLTKVADFSYPLKATGEVHVLKLFSVLSHGTYNAGSLKPSVD